LDYDRQFDLDEEKHRMKETILTLLYESIIMCRFVDIDEQIPAHL